MVFSRNKKDIWQAFVHRGRILTLVLLFTTAAVGAANVASAQETGKRISIRLENVSVLDALREINRLSGNVVVFRSEEVEKESKRVSLDMQDAPVADVVKAALKGTSLNLIERDGRIVVVPQQLESIVKGSVHDESQQPLPGVTVLIKGTTIGTATNEQGEFSLPLPNDKDAVLIFSFVGMETEEFKYAGQKEIKVTMYEDANEMAEVVVTGYQVLDKRTLTSSISTIQAKDLEKIGTLTVDQMLEGKVPGLMITNLSATPGAAAKVRVRSSGTFTGTREPLWVIDGIVYEDPVPLSPSEINSLDNVNLIGNAITGLNPSDIESINILKDASATAIYGTRAANGVIVITTRRGKEGPAVVTYSGSVNFVDRPRYKDFNLMNSKERIDVSREIYERGMGYPSDNNLYTPLAYEKALQDYWKHGNFAAFQKEVSRLECLNYDWFGKLYRTAINQTHSVNISGGTKNLRYYFSIGYDNQKGAEKGVDLERITTRANIDVNIRKNVILQFGMDGSVQKANYNHSSINIFNEAYNMSRAVEATDENGELIYVTRSLGNFNGTQEFGRYNVLNEQANSKRKIDNKAYNFNVTLNWDIIKGVKFTSRFAYRNTTNITEEWIKSNTFYMAQLRSYDEFNDDIKNETLQQYSLAPFGGIFSGGQTTQESMSIRNQLNLVKVLNEDHVFNLNIAQEASTTKYKGATGWQAPGYNHDGGRKFIALPDLQGSAGTSGVEDYTYQSVLKWFTQSGANGHSVYPSVVDNLSNMLSWTGIFTYSYADKYVANFNLRSDGSNTFGQYERYKFKPSWSVSARWNIHKEGFMAKTEKINELALRASYGFRGTTPSASPYLTLMNYGQNTAMYLPETTADLYDFPNANLRWEKTATLNTGIDFSLFDNRLSGAVEYAYSKSTDLLLSRPVSLVNGTASQLYNGGSKEDHTFEFDVRGEVIRTKAARWNVNFNLTRIKENILTGTNVIPGQVSISDYLNGTIMMAGFPVDGFFSYKFGGLDEEGYPTFPELFETYGSEYEKLQNILEYTGNRQPKFYGGFGTEVAYKGFTLSANFNYKIGQKVRLLNLYYNSQQMPLSGDNLNSEFVNRWRKPGDEKYTDIPVLSTDPKTVISGDVGGLYLPSNPTSSLWSLYDLSNIRTRRGDFIRWQSLTLSYSCPQAFLENIGLRSAIIRLQMQNLAVWALDKDLKGQDPEQVMNIGLPVLPSYNLGLTISF